MYFKALTLILLYLSVSTGQADLYKWVDENGKTYYSDKQHNKKEQSKIIPIENPAKKTYGQSSKEKAIIRPYEKISRKILLTDIIYRWRKESQFKTFKKVGAYYQGKHCSPREAINVPDVYTYHSDFFPTESSLPKNIKLIIKSLGYDAEVTTEYSLLDRIEKTGGVNLQAEIYDINLNSCAPVYNPAGFVSPTQLPAHNFKKNRVYLKIKWQLKTKREQITIFETETSAFYDGWYKVTSVEKAIRKAVETATINLFSDEAFIAKIIQSKQVETKQVKRNDQPDAPQQEESFWSKILPFVSSSADNSISNALTNQYMLRAKLASVFSEISSIKISLESYYFMQGSWPRHKEDIGLNDAMFVNHKLITDLNIESDGTISVDLQDVFGPHKILQLTPETEAFNNAQTHGLKWQCYSNIDKAINPADCEPI